MIRQCIISMDRLTVEWYWCMCMLCFSWSVAIVDELNAVMSS